MSTTLGPALRSRLAEFGRTTTEDLAPYAVDGLAPSIAVAPASAEGVAAVLRAAAEHGAAVIPWGGGRHMALGNPPSRYDVALLTRQLDSILEHEPADLTVTAEAGVTLGDLQTLLAERGQFLPIDGPAGATIGGLLAAGIAGPSSHAYGLPRDWLIGCRIAHVDGTVSKGGGRVVKNVAGYDLMKLAVGSLGTLGVTVDATFKLAPLPKAQETLLARFESPSQAFAAAYAADERALALRALAVRATVEGQATAAFWLAGPPSAVDRTRREITELASRARVERLEGTASQRWWEALCEPPPHETLALRASLLPTGVPDFIEKVRLLGFASVAYPTTGIVLAQNDAGGADRDAAAVSHAREHARAAGGSLVVISAPLAVKERVDAWGEEASSVARRLKAEFDPAATLNPGRFAGRL